MHRPYSWLELGRKALPYLHTATNLYSAGSRLYNMAFGKSRMPYRRSGFNRRKTFRKKPMRRRYYRKPKRTYRRRRTALKKMYLKGYNNKKYACVSVTFKTTFEQSWTWAMKAGATGTKPAFQNFTDPWLPLKGHQSEADEVWDRYKVHRLKNFRWRMDNFRMFKTDYTVFGAATTPIAAPAIQVGATEQLTKWRLWYKRDHDAAAETLAPDEEQFTKKDMTSLKSYISGIQHYRANGYQSNPETITNSELHTLTFDQYLEKFVLSPIDNAAAKVNQTVGLFIMPDDPLPSSVYTAARQCNLDMVNDCTVYVTFDCFDRKKDSATNVQKVVKRVVME